MLRQRTCVSRVSVPGVGCRVRRISKKDNRVPIHSVGAFDCLMARRMSLTYELFKRTRAPPPTLKQCFETSSLPWMYYTIAVYKTAALPTPNSWPHPWQGCALFLGGRIRTPECQYQIALVGGWRTSSFFLPACSEQAPVRVLTTPNPYSYGMEF